MKKLCALACAIVLCLTAAVAFATSTESGENVKTGQSKISAYDQTQYVELKKGEKLAGAALGDTAAKATAANIAALTSDANVASFEIEGIDSKTIEVINSLSADEKGVAIVYLLGFYSDVEDAKLPAEVKAIKEKLGDGKITVANIASTSMTYEGKAAELRTITIKVVAADGTVKYERFNYVRIVGEVEWTLVSANEALQ